MFVLKRMLGVLSIFLLASCTLQLVPNKPVYDGRENDPVIDFRSEYGMSTTFLGELGVTYFNKEEGIAFNSHDEFDQYIKQNPEALKAGELAVDFRGQTVKETLGDSAERRLWLKYLKQRRDNIKWLGSVTHWKGSAFFKVPANSHEFSMKLPANQSVALQGFYRTDSGHYISYCIPDGVRFFTKPKTKYVANFYDQDSRCGFDVKEVLPNGSQISVIGIPENLHKLAY